MTLLAHLELELVGVSSRIEDGWVGLARLGCLTSHSGLYVRPAIAMAANAGYAFGKWLGIR